MRTQRRSCCNSCWTRLWAQQLLRWVVFRGVIKAGRCWRKKLPKFLSNPNRQLWSSTKATANKSHLPHQLTDSHQNMDKKLRLIWRKKKAAKAKDVPVDSTKLKITTSVSTQPTSHLHQSRLRINNSLTNASCAPSASSNVQPLAVTFQKPTREWARRTTTKRKCETSGN